ncbi:MAG: hypothetical protein WBD41_26030, partial [Rhodococcus sp. (in: high G+C Gram-positive bacteria)]
GNAGANTGGNAGGGTTEPAAPTGPAPITTIVVNNVPSVPVVVAADAPWTPPHVEWTAPQDTVVVPVYPPAPPVLPVIPLPQIELPRIELPQIDLPVVPLPTIPNVIVIDLPVLPA